MMTVFVARLLGLDEYGVFAYALAWASVLFVFSDLGFQRLLTKHLAEYVAVDEPNHILGLIRYAHRMVLPTLAVIVVASALVALIVVESAYLTAVLLILPAVFLRGFSFIWVGVLQGLRHTELSFLPIFIVLPLGLMAIAGGLDLAGVSVDAEIMVVVYVLMGGVILLVSASLGWHFLRPIVAGARIELEERTWLRTVLPFTAVLFLAALSSQVGTFMLGGFGEPADVGAYSVALKLGEPALMAVFAIEAAIAPKIAALYRTGDKDHMKNVIRKGNRFALAMVFARRTDPCHFP